MKKKQSTKSISEYFAEVKGLMKTLPSEWFVMVIVIGVGFSGFALGRLSAFAEGRAPISIKQVEVVAQAEPMQLGGLLVASRYGSKYHFPWCSGAQRIREENKIWFENESEARVAGYEPAGNCKGL